MLKIYLFSLWVQVRMCQVVFTIQLSKSQAKSLAYFSLHFSVMFFCYTISQKKKYLISQSVICYVMQSNMGVEIESHLCQKDTQQCLDCMIKINYPDVKGSNPIISINKKFTTCLLDLPLYFATFPSHYKFQDSANNMLSVITFIK